MINLKQRYLHSQLKEKKYLQVLLLTTKNKSILIFLFYQIKLFEVFRI